MRERAIDLLDQLVNTGGGRNDVIMFALVCALLHIGDQIGALVRAQK